MIAIVGARVFDAVDGSASERTVIVHNGLIGAVGGPGTARNHADRRRADSFRHAYRARVRFAAGTPFNHHGGLPDEIAGMVHIGLSPAEALIAATRNAAANLGMSDALGTIEVGKVADLVLVEGDPLTDIAALRRVRRVIQGGVPLPPAAPR